MIKDEKTIKRELLNRFRAQIEKGELRLSPLWLQLVYFEQLHPVEQRRFKTAVKELMAKGLIVDTGVISPNLHLTDKGYDLLFARTAA